MEFSTEERGQLLVASSPTNQDVIWSSSDTSVVLVDGNGRLESMGAGSAIVTAAINYHGEQYEDECFVTVISPIAIGVTPETDEPKASEPETPSPFATASDLSTSGVPVPISQLHQINQENGGFLIEYDVTDINGGTWESPCYYAALHTGHLTATSTANVYSIFEGSSSVIYQTGRDYYSLTGTVILPMDQSDTQDATQINVYGDGELLYSSPFISGRFSPLDFEIDIFGVDELKIEIGGVLRYGSPKCVPRIANLCAWL